MALKPIPYTSIATEGLRRKLRERNASRRRCRLFSVACCRLDLDAITHPESLALIDLAERSADDTSLQKRLVTARRAVFRWARSRGDILHDSQLQSRDRRWVARWGAYQAASDHNTQPVYGFLNERLYRPFLADIFGASGCPTPFPESWRSESAIALARTAYDTRDFALLPILADALEEAGCDHSDVLSHCRDPQQVHVRGCWVVDGVLGKS